MTATAHAVPPSTADPKRWLALLVLSSSLFIIVLDNTIVNVAVPTIIRELHTDVSSLQWVISGYSLVFASLLISFGRLGDIFGRRRLFFIGATHTLTRRIQDWWLTAVGEVPAQTLRSFSLNLERRK